MYLLGIYYKLEPKKGFEPFSCRYEWQVLPIKLFQLMKRAIGIEPTTN
jgi:hypothetical protein